MDTIDYKTFDKPAAIINELKEFFGPKCSGIKINGEPNTFFNEPKKPMKFCEAVNYSFNVPIIMKENILDCPGARRSLGFDRDSDKLAKTISKNAHMPRDYIRELLNDVPVINTTIKNILMGITADMGENTIPDVYIIYTRPDKIMKFIHTLTRMKIKPKIPPYNLNSICGSVFSRAYQNREITISFGCPDSRKYGGVKNDEVILCLPNEYAEYFINENSVT